MSITATVSGMATTRRAGRRAISMALLLIGLVALVSGIWSLFLARGSFAVPLHAATGIMFALLSLAHVRLNRNAIRLYMRDLGWSPAFLRLLVGAAISLVLLVSTLQRA
jgi:hypothetical protein